MTSVCTGALPLAAAGLLEGRRATTARSRLDVLESIDPSIDVQGDVRFVDDGDLVTAAGLSAGMDMALHLVGRLASPERSRRVRDGIETRPIRRTDGSAPGAALENGPRRADERAQLRITRRAAPDEGAAKLRHPGDRDVDQVEVPHVAGGRRDGRKDDLAPGHSNREVKGCTLADGDPRPWNRTSARGGGRRDRLLQLVRPVAEEHRLVVGELLDIDRVAIRQRMVAGNGEGARLTGENRPDDQVGLFQRDPGRDHVNVVVTQAPERVVPGHLHDLDPALRVLRLERSDDLDQAQAAGWPTQQAELQRSLELACGRARPLEDGVELIDDRAEVALESLAERGQLDAATGAVNELCPTLRSSSWRL